MIRVAAKKHKVKPALVKSIVAAESAFNANAVSPKGALGLMQLMPETAEQYGADPLIPEQNIDAGTRVPRRVDPAIWQVPQRAEARHRRIQRRTGNGRPVQGHSSL